jgi:cytochrome b561
MNDSRQKLSTMTVSLHWIISATVIFMLVLGFYMATTRTYSLWDLHKSTGIAIFAVVVIRLLWRIRNGWPQPVSVYSRVEQSLAKIVHWVMIVATVIMPLSGMVSAFVGGHDLTLYGWELLADNPDPSGKLRVLPRNEALHEFLGEVHTTVAWILAAAVLLHIAGALKHHLVDKDGTLRRMLGARVG